uniref:Gfo/Idh/MocA family oxidoreductase n=1 Tax=Roseihalotalea indica TaxID=2867963 RepID=A0AA49GSQ4_9BACT|nr:Gfo/Idh/MocA family oxidoreductase [Tunicatimonas sp. TK19036]
MSSFIHRREFIRQASLSSLGIAFLPYYRRKVAPSDTLRIAIVGVGGMGRNHLKWFAELPEVNVVALADVDEDHLNEALAQARELQSGVKVEGYSDFRRILERDDVDAISCATPDHWHAQVAMLAFQAGKDVYGEKPLAYSIEEGQAMLKEQEKYQRIFQLGTQIHATDNYHRVAELLHAGVIGDIETVRLWKTGESPGLGHPAHQAPPAQLNWDMWLGPAPYTEYFPERCHFTYRYFLDYSGGVYQDFWCHIADIAFWGAKPTGLKTISAKGEPPADGVADVPAWINVDFEFENLNLHWTTEPPNVPGAADRGIGAYFEGKDGTLICDYNTHEVTVNGEKLTEIPEVDQSIPRSPGHQQNFVDAVKARTQPESNLAYARQMTLPMHLGLISFRVGRPLTWNAKKEKCQGDKEANDLLGRKPRKEWNLT